MVVPLPPFNPSGDLPPGVHRATLREVGERFGAGSIRRGTIAARLERIDHLARSTGRVARLVVFGSSVTVKPEPNDIDIFLLMEDDFDSGGVVGEAVDFCQTKRDGSRRGIVEIEPEGP